jgi:hypothetical protein
MKGTNMATFTINGVTFSGSNVTIRNGTVIIDGQVQEGTLNGIVEVRIVEGVLNHLTSDASVNCGQVNGNVSAGGSVNCDAVGGNVNAGGSVKCDDVGGDVIAGGSVRRS